MSIFDRITDTGLASRTSLRRGAGRLSTEHLLRMNGKFNKMDILDVNTEPALRKTGYQSRSREHMERMLSAGDAARSEAVRELKESKSRSNVHPDTFYRESNNMAFNKTTGRHSGHGSFHEVATKVLPTVTEVQSLARRQGHSFAATERLTFAQIKEDSARDLQVQNIFLGRTKRRLLHYFDSRRKEAGSKFTTHRSASTSLMKRSKQKSPNVSASRLLREESLDYNKAQLHRLSQFSGLAAFFENVQFVVKIVAGATLKNNLSAQSLSQLPKPGYQSKGRATLRIKTVNLKRNLSRPLSDGRSATSVTMPVQRGNLVDFNLNVRPRFQD